MESWELSKLKCADLTVHIKLHTHNLIPLNTVLPAITEMDFSPCDVLHKAPSALKSVKCFHLA